MSFRKVDGSNSNTITPCAQEDRNVEPVVLRTVGVAAQQMVGEVIDLTTLCILLMVGNINRQR